MTRWIWVSVFVSVISMAFTVLALYVPVRWIPVPVVGFVALIFTLVRNPVGRYFRVAMAIIGLWCSVILKPVLDLKFSFEENISVWASSGHAEWYVHLLLGALVTIFITFDYFSRKIPDSRSVTKNRLTKYKYELSLVALLSILATTIAISSIAADVAKTEIELSKLNSTSDELILLEKNTAQTLAGVSERELDVGIKTESLVNFSLYLEHIESLGFVAINPTSGNGLGLPGTLVHIDSDGVIQFVASPESVFPGLPTTVTATAIPELQYTTGEEGLNLDFRAKKGRIIRSSQLDILNYLDLEVLETIPDSIKNLDLLVVSSSLEGGSMGLRIQGKLKDETKYYQIESIEPIVIGLQFYKFEAFSVAAE